MWVPRGAVLQALIDADGPHARAQVIRDHEPEILDDCAASLDTAHHPDLTELADFAKEALAAHRTGHVAGDQALATNVLETALQQHTPGRVEFAREVMNKGVSDEDALQKWVLLLTAAGIPTAYRNYQYKRRDPGYSRHGTVHAVNAALYSRDNSLRAITLATSWLRYLSKYRHERDARATKPVA